MSEPMPMHKGEAGGSPRIIAVAIIFGTEIWLGYEPERHHDVIRRHTEYTKTRGSGCQGFLDSNGQFWTREEAWGIAEKAGQILPNKPYAGSGELYSEDIW